MKESSKGQQVKDLQRRLNIMGDAVKELEEKNRVLFSKMKILEAEKAQWEVEKVKQQFIIQQALQKSNATNNSYLEEVQQLQLRVRELEALVKN